MSPSRYSRSLRHNGAGPWRTTPVVFTAVVLALLLAACGGSPAGSGAHLGSSTTQAGTTSGRPGAPQQLTAALAYSRCMRSKGVPGFPDPDSSGGFPKSLLARLATSSPRFPAAQRACQDLLPNGGNPPSLSRQQQERLQGLKFSQCVRRHGITGFPDPGSDGRIPDPASMGIDQGSPQFQAANEACRTYRPPYMPSNAAYNAWVRTSTSD